jgi:sugar O-acyltransferase (sialic acid O-acetyltransferase NeuD family)
VSTDQRRVVLIGAGGLAREAAEAAPGRVAGFLDDDPAKQGTTVGGLPVLGFSADVLSLETDLGLVAGVARSSDTARRTRLVSRLGLADDRYTTIVHPSAALAASTSVGVGSIVLALVVATCDVTIGRHVAVMPGCVLTHDVTLRDGVTLASGVQLAGGVVVEEDAYLGSGALVREGVRIGREAVVGMGAVVTQDVPAGQTWVGVPARKLR